MKPPKHICDDQIFAMPTDQRCGVRVEGSIVTVRWPQAGSQTRLLPWTDGLRVIEHQNGVLQVPQPLYQSFYLDVFDWWDDDLSGWLDTIPNDLLCLSKNLSSLRLPILQLASRYSVAEELFRSHPNLMMVFFCFARDQCLPESELVSTLSLKRVDILRAMGLPRRKAILKFLSRLVITHFKRSLFDKIMRICGDENRLSRLAHIERITEEVISLSEKLPWLVGRRLFDEMIAANTEPCGRLECSRIAEDVIRMGGVTAARTMQSMKSLEQLHRLHDRMMLEVDVRDSILRDGNGKPAPFPTQPIKVVGSIYPVSSYADLMMLGKRMLHCVSSYTREIQMGKYYIYQLDEPELVTIGLAKNSAGWHLDQIKGVRNKPVSRPLELQIMAWLKSEGV